MPFMVSSKLRPGTRFTYEWWTRSQMGQQNLLEVLKNCGPAPKDAFETRDLSTFNKMLQEHGIDASQFGNRGHKSLQDLANEVRSGEARLLLDATEHKKLVRVVYIVAIRLWDSG